MGTDQTANNNSQMKDSSLLEEEITEEDNGELYIAYYIRQREIWFPMLLSFYILLNVIALIISYSYPFDQIFASQGVFMLLLSIEVIIVVVLERNYLWALLSSLIIGLMPIIELIIFLVQKSHSSKALGLLIFSLVFCTMMLFLPYLGIYYFERQEKNKPELTD
jgi:hypothetical protein